MSQRISASRGSLLFARVVENNRPPLSGTLIDDAVILTLERSFYRTLSASSRLCTKTQKGIPIDLYIEVLSKIAPFCFVYCLGGWFRSRLDLVGYVLCPGAIDSLFLENNQ